MEAENNQIPPDNDQIFCYGFDIFKGNNKTVLHCLNFGTKQHFKISLDDNMGNKFLLQNPFFVETLEEFGIDAVDFVDRLYENQEELSEEEHFLKPKIGIPPLSYEPMPTCKSSPEPVIPDLANGANDIPQNKEFNLMDFIPIPNFTREDLDNALKVLQKPPEPEEVLEITFEIPIPNFRGNPIQVFKQVIDFNMKQFKKNIQSFPFKPPFKVKQVMKENILDRLGINPTLEEQPQDRNIQEQEPKRIIKEKQYLVLKNDLQDFTKSEISEAVNKHVKKKYAFDICPKCESKKISGVFSGNDENGNILKSETYCRNCNFKIIVMQDDQGG